MFPAEFDYYRAKSIAEAGRLLAEHPGARLMAGGHSLIPLMKLRLAAPDAVIDIGRVAELRGIAETGDALRIGAATTHAELAASSVLRKRCPVLAEAASLIGDPAVRNRGTIGGNVAHADPASDLPTVLTILEARFSAIGRSGERTIAARDFFVGLMETALAADEILTSITLPAVQRGDGAAYIKFTHPASRYAVVGAAAYLTLRDGRCGSARIALGGLVPRPARLASVEAALAGAALTPQMIGQAAAKTPQDLGDDVLGDAYASADYRRAVAGVYVKRAVEAAARRAGAA